MKLINNILKLLIKKPHLLNSLRSEVINLYLSEGKSQEAALQRLKKLKQKELKKHELKVSVGKSKTLFSSENEHSLYDLALAGWKGSYFCNFTSIYFHNLTNQIPNTIYLAFEVPRQKDQLTIQKISDQAIFDAFIKPHRITNKVYQYHKQRLVITERVYRSNLGVENIGKDKKDLLPNDSKVTSKERALIDAVISPQHNGGISSVLQYYKNASAKIDLDKFLKIYDGLALIYPYWQTIGFIFDRIGSQGKADIIYNRYKIQNQFYLDHEAKTSWEFDSKWNLYFPKELVA